MLPLAALPMVTLKISPYTNVTLNWITLFMGNMGESALRREESNCQTKKIKIWSWAPYTETKVTVKQRKLSRQQDELADRSSVVI
jgi:hypothetical protein